MTFEVRLLAGSTPPKQLAQQFLSKAEELRGAAITVAVEHLAAEAAREEAEAEREASQLHRELALRGAMQAAEHTHRLRDMAVREEAAHALLTSHQRHTSPSRCAHVWGTCVLSHQCATSFCEG